MYCATNTKEKIIMIINADIAIKAVDKNNWNDFETLFESRGGPKYCWCMAWRLTKDELKENTSACRKECIKKRVFPNIPIGLLAYMNKDAIAWCSVAPRITYQRLKGDETKKDVWSIACFYVKRAYRKNGLAHILIEEAKKYAKNNGAKYIEAYPVEPDSPSYRFMGFIKQFEKAGFKYIKKAGTRRNVMIYEFP